MAQEIFSDDVHLPTTQYKISDKKLMRTYRTANFILLRFKKKLKINF